MPHGSVHTADIDGPSSVPASLRVAPNSRGYAQPEIWVGQVQETGGVIVIDAPTVPTNMVMNIERVTFSVNPRAPAPNIRMFAGNITDRDLVDGAPDGSETVGEYNPPLIIPAGSRLRVQWIGAGAGAIGTARLQYRLTAVA